MFSWPLHSYPTHEENQIAWKIDVEEMHDGTNLVSLPIVV